MLQGLIPKMAIGILKFIVGGWCTIHYKLVQ